MKSNGVADPNRKPSILQRRHHLLDMAHETIQASSFRIHFTPTFLFHLQTDGFPSLLLLFLPSCFRSFLVGLVGLVDEMQHVEDRIHGPRLQMDLIKEVGEAGIKSRTSR